MKKLNSSLYVTSEGAWLHKDGKTVVVEVDGVERGRVPIHLLDQIICFGKVGMSPALMNFCAENNVSISFLSVYGRFLARIEGPQSGNVSLRRIQHTQTFCQKESMLVARAVVLAKVANQRAVIRRHIRDYGSQALPSIRSDLDYAQQRLNDCLRYIQRTSDLESLRGQEGDAAKIYFSVFDHLIRNDNPIFRFSRRVRRPPRDAVNAVLSFLYVLLAQDCRSACETNGLDPQMGFLHRDRPGRMSLALDLMEEFRAPIADRICLSLINRRQLKKKDFRYEDTGAVYLDEEGRTKVLKAWQERKRKKLRHLFIDEVIPLGLMPQIQTQLLARYLRGDIDGYPSYIWR